jgi:N-glycosylase/DNA lyase
VVAGRVFALRQTDSDVLYRKLPLRPAPGIAAAQAVPPAPSHALDDAAALRDYFALDVALAPLHAHFSAVDPARFAALAPFVRGARVLRQPPDECLFAFICSSNNHVSRIEGMVQRLCAAYGTCLGVHEASAEPYYAFPTPEQLAGASEEQLRALGFGYRAKARP